MAVDTSVVFAVPRGSRGATSCCSFFCVAQLQQCTRFLCKQNAGGGAESETGAVDASNIHGTRGCASWHTRVCVRGSASAHGHGGRACVSVWGARRRSSSERISFDSRVCLCVQITSAFVVCRVLRIAAPRALGGAQGTGHRGKRHGTERCRPHAREGGRRRQAQYSRCTSTCTHRTSATLKHTHAQAFARAKLVKETPIENDAAAASRLDRWEVPRRRGGWEGWAEPRQRWTFS